MEIRKEYEGLRPEDIKVMDPCMGSGHILVYAFDVLMRIYESAGYTQRDAAQAILEYNLFGLDIDRRAAQLAYFAVMMKARQYDRRIFSRGIKPHVYAIEESNGVNRSQMKFFGCSLSDLERNMAMSETNALLDTLEDAKEYGSILNVDNYNRELLGRFARDVDIEDQMSMETIGIEHTQEKLLQLLELGQVMTQKYDVVVTNPPYMGVSGMGAKLSKYVKGNYPDSKSDLFAVFIERCGQMVKRNGYQAMITQHAWMFLSSFEKLRAKILQVDTVNMAHLGARAFEEIGGEVVQTTSFVLRRSQVKDYKGTYCRLIEPTTQQGKEDMFLAGENRYVTQQDNFSKIPGSPVAYWVSEAFYEIFKKGVQLAEYANARQGMKTCDNERFIRLWHEVSINKCYFNAKSIEDAKASNRKWFPINHGGEFRKYYGNNCELVNWENDGEEMKSLAIQKYGCVTRTITNINYYFKEGLTWTVISSASTSFRRYYHGHLFSNSGQSIVPEDLSVNLDYLIGLLNSKVVNYTLSVLSPTLGFESGYLKILPIIDTGDKVAIRVAKENILTSRIDWDSFETSWDFQRHPLLPYTVPQELEINENTLEFAVFCVEMLSKELNTTGDKVYDLLTVKSDLLDSYILPCYEMLHTQSREYIVNDLLEVMRQKGVIA